MTLLGAIMEKAKTKGSCDSVKKFSSPPPEVLDFNQKEKKKRKEHPYSKVRAKVDSTPPPYCPLNITRRVPERVLRLKDLISENRALIIEIRKIQLAGGKVDCRWRHAQQPSTRRYEARAAQCRRLLKENLVLHRRFTSAGPKVQSASSLAADWSRLRRVIIDQARCRFVLFPPVPRQLIEDSVFLAPPGVKRPRVTLYLRMEGHASLGELHAELFAEACPRTCALFAELLVGEGGYGYVGTQFFRKVPNLYWCGGDVVYDCGGGCYAPRGRTAPIPPENYHFSHSMPGLLSMRVSSGGDVCGQFSITFKPLPQLDLKNVVFGRIIRPSAVFDAIQALGAPLTPRPTVRITAARLQAAGRVVWGAPNTQLQNAKPKILSKNEF